MSIYSGSTEIKEIYLGTPRLPNTYQEVEYIESSGTQYINTGYTHTANTKVNLGFSITQNTSDWQFLFGQRTIYQQPTALDLAYQSTNGKLGFKMGTSTTYDSFSSISLNTKYEILMTPTTTWLSNGATASFNKVLQAGSGPCYLFWCNAEFSGLKPYAKIYFCKIYDGDTLVRNFIPCYRKSDNVIGLYDLVNNTFYTNAGTGTFTKGNNKNTPTQIKEVYVGSTKVRPGAWNFYYDFRGGSLAGFQAAGGYSIETNGSYSITSEGLQQTGGGTDRYEVAIVNIPDISNATSIEIQSLGFYIAGSRSNSKRVMIGNTSSWDYGSSNWLAGAMAMNTSNPGSNNIYGIILSRSNKSIEKVAGNQGDTIQTLNINLGTGLVTYTNTGANTKTFTYTMTSSELAALKTWRYVYFQKERGYSSQNGESIKTVGITIN